MMKLFVVLLMIGFIGAAYGDCIDTASPAYCTRNKPYCKTDRLVRWVCPKTCGLCGGGGGKKLKCGESIVKQTRIIGGVDAKPAAWPWLASFQRKYMGVGSHFCGGTLLAPRWVLTASHCVIGITHHNLHTYSVKLGSHDHREHEPWVQERAIKRLIRNPHWDRKVFVGDMTLLELKTPVKLNGRVNIACLPEKGVYPPIGKECMLAGWGSVKYPGPVYHLLQQVKLPVVEMKKCRNHTEDICIGKGMKAQPSGKQQPNACRGDSGGPLVCARADGRWQVDGVASFVYTYCKYYTAFSPVNKYLDWINSYIKN